MDSSDIDVVNAVEDGSLRDAADPFDVEVEDGIADTEVRESDVVSVDRSRGDGLTITKWPSLSVVHATFPGHKDTSELEAEESGEPEDESWSLLLAPGNDKFGTPVTAGVSDGLDSASDSDAALELDGAFELGWGCGSAGAGELDCAFVLDWATELCCALELDGACELDSAFELDLTPELCCTFELDSVCETDGAGELGFVLGLDCAFELDCTFVDFCFGVGGTVA